MTIRSQERRMGQTFLLCIILLVFFPCLKSYGEGNWKELRENEIAIYFYDTSSVKQVQSGVFTVWSKTIVSKETSQRLSKVAPYPAGLYQIKGLNIIDCGNNRYFIARSIFYDKKGKVLHDSGEDKEDYTRYRPIPEDTPIDSISQEVCKFVKGQTRYRTMLPL